MTIGLTGKICAGKDEAASSLASLGAYVIDLDKLGHEALIQNKEKLVSAFGSGIINGDAVDRKKLASLVFSDEKELRKLESISHPWMIKETRARAEKALREKRIVVINAAILKRLGLDEICDEILFIDAPFELRAKRAEIRNGIRREEFRKRDENQKDIVSTFEDFQGTMVVIVNDSDKAGLYRQVKNYYDTILARG